MKPTATTNKPTWQYFRVSSTQCTSRVSLCSLTDLVRYAEMHNIRTVLMLGGESDSLETVSHFALLHNGSLIEQAAQGYETIEDFTAADKAAFPDSAAYYDARKLGISSHEDYKLACEAGIAEAPLLATIKEKGFATGFAAWQKLAEELPGLPDLGPVTNPRELYEAALRHNFPDYPTLEQALRRGFSEYDDYRTATDKKFPDAATYDDAIRRGFLSYKDYQFAQEQQLRDASDAAAYLNMVHAANGKKLAFDKKALLIFLSKLEEGKRISINKLTEHFEKALAEYKYADSGELPAWFTISLHSREELATFISGSDDAKRYGTYDAEGEFFEVAALRDRHVVLDGSNVAHNSAQQKDKKPTVANILKVVAFLRSKGFEKVSVITDASLRRQVADGDLFGTLDETAKHIEAPVERSADQFLLDYVKKNHCLIVSNDTFRSWKMADPWVAANIDFYRLTFMIKDDIVLMPDIDAHG